MVDTDAEVPLADMSEPMPPSTAVAEHPEGAVQKVDGISEPSPR
jgi:hypothetical protein